MHQNAHNKIYNCTTFIEKTQLNVIYLCAICFAYVCLLGKALLQLNNFIIVVIFFINFNFITIILVITFQIH